MSDSYQAIYDAVRSRIHNGDVGRAIQDAIGSGLDASIAIRNISDEFLRSAYEMQRPSVLWRPSVAPDGNKWCALYGENLTEGVCGFGDTPEEAMRDFDNNWWKEKTPVAVQMAAEEATNNSQFGVGA